MIGARPSQPGSADHGGTDAARTAVASAFKIDVVNGLRGWAILAVIFHHLSSHLILPGYGSFQLGHITMLPYAFLSNGWLGVNLFFVLSGFVLSLPFFTGRQLRSRSDLAAFYMKRGHRLLPLFYLCVLVSMAFLVPPESPRILLRDGLFLLTGTFTFNFDLWAPRYSVPLWSLGLEIWFSLLLPVLLLAIHRYGIRTTAVLVLCVALAVRLYGNNVVYWNPYVNPVKDSVIGRLDDFFMGIVVCYVYTRKLIAPERWQSLLLFVAGAVLLYCASASWDYVRLGIVSRSVVPFLNNVTNIGCSLVLTALLTMKAGVVRKAFDNFGVQLIGCMCFSLYVWHLPAIAVFRGQLTLGGLVQYGVLVFALAGLTYRYVEFGHVPDTRQLLPRTTTT